MYCSFCPIIGRAYISLKEGDMREAIEHYRRLHGEPTIVLVHPKAATLLNEVPAGIKTETSPGVLAWEIRVGEWRGVAPLPGPAKVQNEKTPPIQTPKSPVSGDGGLVEVVSKLPNKGILPPRVIKHTGGRPRSKLDSLKLSRMTKWRRKRERQLELIPAGRVNE